LKDAGGICLKTLLAYVKNIGDNPAEEKFRNINAENRAYKTRIHPVVGGPQVGKRTAIDDDTCLLILDFVTAT